MTETKTEQGISTAIITDKDRVLMIRRREREGKLLWAFPGGGIEDGDHVHPELPVPPSRPLEGTSDLLGLLAHRPSCVSTSVASRYSCTGPKSPHGT